MAGTVWSGYLTFGLVSIPVKLYPAARSESISFNMLHKDCGNRVKQQLICPEHGVLSRDQIIKGYEYEKGRYVEITAEEIKKIEPATARAMEILQFVEQREVDPLYFDASYYLVPDEPGRRAYALLHKALGDSNMYGIAQMSMHNREYTVIIRPLREGIAIHTMFYENEVRRIQEMGQANGTEVKEKELQLANSLIDSLRSPFDPAAYHDDFEKNLQHMLQEKIEGHEVQEVEKPRMAPVVDLMAALKASLKNAEKLPRKVVARAGESEAEEPAEQKSQRRAPSHSGANRHRARNG